MQFGVLAQVGGILSRLLFGLLVTVRAHPCQIERWVLLFEGAVRGDCCLGRSSGGAVAGAGLCRCILC